MRVLVDGGANHWFNFIAEHNLSECVEPPHFITGDMDSVSKESLQRLDALKCQRIYTPDQNETDCTKSLIAIRPYLQSTKVIEKKTDLKFYVLQVLIDKFLIWIISNFLKYRFKLY